MKKRSLLRANAKGIASIGSLTVIFVLTVFAPLFAPFDPYRQSLQDILIPPGSTYSGDGGMSLLGTDQLGRDVLSRLLYGAGSRSGSVSSLLPSQVCWAVSLAS
ncbi:hypothetical protein [Paenibacillus sp. DCT19]|uniref:hypothetical protein n=1 Tax=Paenibacillus sp. DCT19 TaxID=2211212 RepID=UPI000FE1F745|nr:hypothetical protein [Paenibacillus sp. DCT19]